MEIKVILTIEFSSRAWGVMDEIREATGDDVGDVIRKAMSLYYRTVMMREAGEFIRPDLGPEWSDPWKST